MTCDIYFGREFNGESNVNIFRVIWGSLVVTIEPNWPEGPVSEDRTGPKGQYIRTKLARRASKSGQNWPEGSVQQDQTVSKTI